MALFQKVDLTPSNHFAGNTASKAHQFITEAQKSAHVQSGYKCEPDSTQDPTMPSGTATSEKDCQFWAYKNCVKGTVEYNTSSKNCRCCAGTSSISDPTSS